MIPHYPDYTELLDTCAEYVRCEQGDTVYEVAQGWIQLHWGDAHKVAGGVRILEETWNRAFYAYGIFDMEQLVTTIEAHTHALSMLRSRQLETFADDDEQTTSNLWQAFFEALRPRGQTRSPYVATAKALHVLAPSFFVPFDAKICKYYSCNIDQPRGFLRFQHDMAEMAHHILKTYTAVHGGDEHSARADVCGSLYLQKTGSRYPKTMAKMLDEYNWVISKNRLEH